MDFNGLGRSTTGGLRLVAGRIDESGVDKGGTEKLAHEIVRK
jgi:hypothetical protein